MDVTVGIVGIIAGIVAIIGLPVGIWFQFFRKADDQDVKIPQPSMSADERERLVRVEAQLAELQEKTTAPPGGSAPLETTTLAAQATEKTERLLGEAIALQDESREREAIERLLTAYNMDMPQEAKAQLHLLVGNGLFRLSDYAAAQHHFVSSLEAGRAADSKEAEANALGNLGLIYKNQGDLAKAEGHIQEALAICRETGNHLGEASQLGNLGLIYDDQGKLTKAKDHLRQALAIFRAVGNRIGEANQLGNLGLIYRKDDALFKAEALLSQGLAIYSEIGYRLGEAALLANLGIIYLRQGEPLKAEEHYQQALAIDQEIGYRLGEANQLGNLGLLAADRNDRDEACQRLKEALSIYDEIGAGGEGPELVRGKLEKMGCE